MVVKILIHTGRTSSIAYKLYLSPHARKIRTSKDGSTDVSDVNSEAIACYFGVSRHFNARSKRRGELFVVNQDLFHG